MGKVKGQNVELMSAFGRMNFLFQASIVASKSAPDSILANYYGRLMKEVSKKLVEKIHPDIKRALCSSCSYPLFTNYNIAAVKVKPHRKKRFVKKNLNTGKDRIMGKCGKDKYTQENECNVKNSCLNLWRLKKDLKPNRLSWSCNRCGFTRLFLQRPSHSLWIDNCQKEDGKIQGSEKLKND